MQLKPTLTTPALEPVVEDHRARRAEVGGSTVLRFLPAQRRRAIGPWIFADLYGPSPVTAGPASGVGPHPHTGLQTVSWLLSGETVHHDSLGNTQTVRPGDVAWMTAGRGIVHAEEQREGWSGTLHGVQLWVALPDAHRHTEPVFDHYSDLPTMALGTARLTVLAGTVGGLTHSVRMFSELVAAELVLGSEPVDLPLHAGHEHGIFVVEGTAEVEAAPLPTGELRYLGLGRSSLRIRGTEGTRLMLLGGEPLGEPVLMWWNFVGRTDAEIRAWQQAWNAGGDAVPGANTPTIPAPPLP